MKVRLKLSAYECDHYCFVVVVVFVLFCSYETL